jgi:hypothetical protein
MTLKLALLKSGEDVIADMQELVVDTKVVGYFFNNPYVVRLKNINSNNDDNKTVADISLYPWMPLSKDKKIPITTDWVVTIVEPVSNLKEMYENIEHRGEEK